jgi:plastocyanin
MKLLNINLFVFSFLFLFLFICLQNNKFDDFISFAQENTTEKTVTIPKGAANPEVDITKFTATQWYKPSPITINVNDTVKWINNDTEPHTVTSGTGAGIASASTNAKGTPNGLFDSGSFKAGSSYSLKFNKTGIYNYFCTIHPWMEGVVIVKGQAPNIPSYAVDINGSKIGKFPIYEFTEDRKTEIGLSWNPQSIKTNVPTNFVMEAFKMPENSLLHLWPYNFVIIQNGKEIYRTSGITQVGSSAERFTFSTPGKVTIKIENGQDPRSFVQYGTIVYNNPNATLTSNGNNNIQNIQKSQSIINPLTLVYSVYAVIIGIPILLVIFIILIKKKKI